MVKLYSRTLGNTLLFITLPNLNKLHSPQAVGSHQVAQLQVGENYN